MFSEDLAVDSRPIHPFIMWARGERTVPAGFSLGSRLEQFKACQSLRLYKPVESIYALSLTAKGG